VTNGRQRVVDLTQPLGPGATVWPGGQALRVEWASSLGEDLTYSRRLSLEEHCGTHIDAPGHVQAGAPLVDAIPVEALVAPACVLDVVADCGDDAAFTVGHEHVEAYEAEHGRIPRGAIALAYTGWDRFLGTPRYLGDGPAFPGYSQEAVAELIERGIVALGVDTAGVDPGYAADLPVHLQTAAAGVYHLEGLVGLDQLPPRGATLFVGAPPLVEGSGVPVRVLALVGE
jgi:kynurenine formamidase